MENLIYLTDIPFVGSEEFEAQFSWKVNNYAFVNKGDVIMEVSIPMLGINHPIRSSYTGIVVKIIRKSIKILHFKPSDDIIVL